MKLRHYPFLHHPKIGRASDGCLGEEEWPVNLLFGYGTEMPSLLLAPPFSLN
jgi:hypothetical protein